MAILIIVWAPAPLQLNNLRQPGYFCVQRSKSCETEVNLLSEFLSLPQYSLERYCIADIISSMVVHKNLHLPCHFTFPLFRYVYLIFVFCKRKSVRFVCRIQLSKVLNY